MKKFLLAFIAIFTFAFATAQEATTPGFSKNDLFVTGSFSYSDATENFNFSASANTFVTSNISVGAGFTRTQVGDLKTNDITANVRNYFTPANQFSLFGEFRVAKNIDGNPNFNLQVNPGINYFISKSFSLETKLGLIGYDTETEDFAFGTDLTNITFGLNYRF